MRRRPRRLLATPTLLGVLMLPGCGGAAPADEAVVRDSAGVRIVESAPHDRPADFAVVAEPALEIGMLEGPPEYTFRNIATARRLEDGRILVADVDDLKLYDPAGRHLATFGRAGEGPGEFTRIRTVYPCGDELLVADFINQRLEAFDPGDGSHRRPIPLPPSGHMFPLALETCRFGDAPIFRAPDPALEPLPDDSARAAIPLMRLDPESTTLDTVMRLPAHLPQDGYPPPFSPRTLLAYGDTMVHVVDTDRFEVRSHARDGALRRIARVPVTPRPVTADDVEREKQAAVDGFPESMRESLRRSLDQATAPESMPVVSRVLVDDAGRVWIRPFRPRWEEPDTLWTVLEADGSLAGTVAMPPEFTPDEIGRDRVLGVWRDELDVGYVRMYRIRND